MRVPSGADETKATLTIRVGGAGLGPLETTAPLAELVLTAPDLDAFLSLASDAKRQGDHERVAKLYAAGIAAYPDDAVLHNEFAWYLLTVEAAAHRDPARALPLARRAVELSGRRKGYILDTLAKALHDTGDLEGAAREAAEAARLSPGHDSIAARAKAYAQEWAAKQEIRPPEPKETP